MSLTKELADYSVSSAERMAADTKERFDHEKERLRASGLGEQGLKVGARVADFTLRNAGGEDVQLADLLAKGPVVLSFYRGGWCPYCNIELRALQRALPEINDFGAELVAISPETPDHAQHTTKTNDLEYEVLNDTGNKVARAFGLVFTLAEELRPIYQDFGIELPDYNGDESFELPVPATCVIGQDGVVRHAFVDPDYSLRLDPDDVVATLKEMKRR